MAAKKRKKASKSVNYSSFGSAASKVKAADVKDKKAGRKPTSFLLKMLKKLPEHEKKLEKIIGARLSKV